MIKDHSVLRMFARNVPCYEDQTFTAIWVDGTGADSLVAQLRNFHPSPSRAGSPIHCAITLGTALSGTLITHEVHHLESLRALYGGAYEIATIINGVCTKIEDVMYVQWFANMNQRGFSFRSLSHVFRYSYWHDLLVIRSVKVVNGTVAHPSEDDSYTLIPPVFRDLTLDDIRLAPVPPLMAPVVSHQITFRALDGEVYTLTRTDFWNIAGFNVVEKELSGAQHLIEFHVADDFFRETADEIRRLMPSKSSPGR